MRWRLDLEYDGQSFAGWQVQPGLRTVQGEVEAALEGFLNHSVRVHPAGRTDAGVHALQQVVRFDTEVDRSAKSVVGALAASLPADVSCWRAAIVDPVFDPRHQPHTKLYRFRFLDRRAPSPLRRGRVWHVRHHLDADAMHSAVLPLVGTLDFSSFRATGCASAHPVRTIKSCEVVRRGDEVHLMVEGTGFLRHMVRILAGTLYEVGAERRPSSWVREVVDQRSRIAAGRTAPPGGLCLVSVRYHAQTTERG